VDGLPDPLAWLEEEDTATRADRAGRAAWLVRKGWPESGWIFFGDLGIIGPWDELRRTFINGEYLATILVGQAFLENVLAGLLEWPEGSVGRAGLAEILAQVRDRGWITPDEHDVLDTVRQMRNPYAHYRNVQHGDSLIRRAMAAGEPPELLVERDARAVVGALFHLVNRHPFALGPIVYPEDDEPLVHPDQTQLHV